MMGVEVVVMGLKRVLHHADQPPFLQISCHAFSSATADREDPRAGGGVGGTALLPDDLG